MNTENESLFTEEGEVVETENPRRNFNEVCLLLMFLFLQCKNKHIDNITKLFVTKNLSISRANYENHNNFNSNSASDIKFDHHALFAKTATSFKVADYDCSLMDSYKKYSLKKSFLVKFNPKLLKFQKSKDKFSTVSLEEN